MVEEFLNIPRKPRPEALETFENPRPVTKVARRIKQEVEQKWPADEHDYSEVAKMREDMSDWTDDKLEGEIMKRENVGASFLSLSDYAMTMKYLENLTKKFHDNAGQ